MELPFNPASFAVLGLVAALLFLLITTAAQSRRYSAQTENKLCPGCGQSHPGFAEFCRRCGRQLTKTKP